MYDRQTPGTPASLESTVTPADRKLRVTPLEMRGHRFRTVLRGFDRAEVVGLLTEAADDYEQALRENDRLRQDLGRIESLLQEHRDREANLRNTLLTAQRLADEIKEAAQNEARLIIKEAQGRADLLLQKSQLRLDEVERDINEMRLRRRDVEGSLEASIQALYHALEFIRDQDRPDDKVLLHRPRQAEGTSSQSRPAAEPSRAADERR